MRNSRFLIVIPARAGSKGIPNKNFLSLGKDLVIDYSIRHALKLNDICDLVISTDNYEFLTNIESSKSRVKSNVQSNHLKEIIEVESGTFLHFRDLSLARDETSIIEVLRDILQRFSVKKKEFEGVILLQPTVPFRSDSDLLLMRNFLINEASESNSLVTFKEVSDSHPARMYIRSKGRNFQNIGLYLEHEQTRRQNLPEVFLRDGCYYFIGRELLARGKQVSENPEGLVRKFPWTINLDVQEDYIMAQIVLQNYRSVLERENAI